MKSKNQVALNLHELSVPDKVQKAEGFVKAISGNTNFANPDTLLDRLKEVSTETQTAYKEALEARSVSVTKTALLHQQEVLLDSAIAALAHYVEAEALGDEVKIKSAGMDVKAKATPVGTPKVPENLAAAEGKKAGTIALKWKGVKGARSYIVRCTTNIAEAVNWQQVAVVTKAAALCEGLKSGQQYWWQVAAVGAAGQGPWSDPAVKIAP